MEPDEKWRKCRKRPVVVEFRPGIVGEEIHTREGVLRAQDGDLVIRGIEGEVYPIGREIFERTYEVIDDEDQVR